MKSLRCVNLLLASVLLFALMACSPATPTASSTSIPPTSAPVPTNPPPAATAVPKATAAPTTAASAGAKKFTMGTVALPVTLDPAFESSANVFPMYESIFDTLVEADDKGQPIPKLAESWKLINDTTWEFKLKKGVKFHNGEPFDANSVKFTVERIADPKNKSNWQSRNAGVDHVEIVDPYTARIVTNGPFSMLFSGLMVDYLLPSKYYNDIGAQAFADKPVGTGPFKVQNWKKNEILDVVKNPDYWGGAAKLDEVVFRQIPEPATLQASFESGESDMAYPIVPDNVNALKAKGLRVDVQPLAFAWTMDIRPQGPGLGPLADVRVRQAVSYAVDAKKIWETVMLGMGQYLDGQVVGPGTTGYNPNVHAYPYDPAKAKDLLKQAGYANGFETTIETPVGRYFKDKETSEAFAAYLGQVGIKATVKPLESAAFVDRSLAGTIGPIFPTAWQAMPALDAHIPLGLFLSTNTRNLGNSKEFDDGWAKAGAALDFSQHNSALLPLAQTMHDQAWAVFMMNIPWVAGIQGRVQGIQLRSNYRFDWLKVDVTK